MIRSGWFSKDKPAAEKALRRPKTLGRPALPGQSEASRFAARLRPHELIAMLTHHYSRARARSLPRVSIALSVSTPSGKPAVTLSCK